MRKILMGLLLFFSSILQAQDAINKQKPASVRFRSINTMGVQWGKEHAGHMLRTNF